MDLAYSHAVAAGGKLIQVNEFYLRSGGGLITFWDGDAECVRVYRRHQNEGRGRDLATHSDAARIRAAADRYLAVEESLLSSIHQISRRVTQWTLGKIRLKSRRWSRPDWDKIDLRDIPDGGDLGRFCEALTRSPIRAAGGTGTGAVPTVEDDWYAVATIEAAALAAPMLGPWVDELRDRGEHDKADAVWGFALKHATRFAALAESGYVPCHACCPRCPRCIYDLRVTEPPR